MTTSKFNRVELEGRFIEETEEIQESIYAFHNRTWLVTQDKQHHVHDDDFIHEKFTVEAMEELLKFKEMITGIRAKLIEKEMEDDWTDNLEKANEKLLAVIQSDYVPNLPDYSDKTKWIPYRR